MARRNTQNAVGLILSFRRLQSEKKVPYLNNAPSPPDRKAEGTSRAKLSGYCVTIFVSYFFSRYLTKREKLRRAYILPFQYSRNRYGPK